MNKKVKDALRLIAPEVLNIRRHLHQYPELSGEEVETSKLIQERLAAYHIPFETGFAKTGVLGIVEGGQPGGTIALRADFDALPIQEENNDAFTSVHPNIMHACGHDAHTAMLLGAGYILNQVKELLPGKILLVFQPAEEKSPIGGAKPMMDDGVFKTHIPDVIFGQHVWPDLPVGQIGIRAGEMMGNSDRFVITVTGSGGHASMPHQTVDAVVAASQIVTALQSIVSRKLNPLDAVVLTIGKLDGGYRYNVIADVVTLEGTLRTFRNETKQQAKAHLYAISESVAKAMGAEAKVVYYDGYPATVNSRKWANLVKKTAQAALGEEGTPDIQPSLGGEDFARYLEKYPGAFFWLGTQLKNKEWQKPLHDPGFSLNEDALSIGTELMTNIAIEALYMLKNEKWTAS
ncbi:M20 metallopeptidase family protein [Bacillus chungangensis]|uniref:Amidohydrolase n=1 Tax=Bacillus chungangensis TaxID=587633 RepID=A0ABT9WV54_9BACI|nr:M20 family metallopeptidase [Bacillus chungangensis]MDQ0177188.1 amidohydrolase [Bacillus chungangensis]